MSYNPATDPYRFGWQTQQFAVDGNDPSAGTVIDGLAYPAATAVAALLHKFLAT